LLKQAVTAELEAYLSQHTLVDEEGHRKVVRNGYLPERTIQTGLGNIAIQVPRVRDRSGKGQSFHSALLPPYLKRTKSLETLLPWLYLKGLSSGDFSEALQALLGPQPKGVSASTIGRLKTIWQEEHEAFQHRDLSGKRYVYFWVDGIYLQARLEQKQCILVIIGADATGTKELVALQGGFRESELSWMELLRDLHGRGLTVAPELAVGDGALGFWNALSKVYGTTKQQRWWVHKTANVLNKLPDKVQRTAKHGLHQIWIAETEEDAKQAMDQFAQTYGDKYPKAVDCLVKDQESLLAFYRFPAAHWLHIRTTNPIESVFATVRLRTEKTKGCLSLQSAEIMTYKLIDSAQKRWLRLRGSKHLAEVIEGVNFTNGVRSQLISKETNACAA
jgi:transposase-like protein